MKRFLTTGLIGIGMVLASVPAPAQVYAPGRVYRGEGYRFAGGDRLYPLMNQVQSDLQRAASFGYLRGGEIRRIQSASRDLAEFHARWNQGRFDRHELDEAIGRIQSVVDRAGLRGRDRAALQDDANRLRELRASVFQGGGAYGYRR